MAVRTLPVGGHNSLWLLLRQRLSTSLCGLTLLAAIRVTFLRLLLKPVH